MALYREIRNRARQVAPQVLAACLVAYFAFHAMQGDRGVNSWLELKQELAQARETEALLLAQRQELAHRVNLLRPDHLDPDLLEERARVILNYGHADEYIVLLPGERVQE